MKNNMLTRTFLSFTYTSDIKSLQGFVKGGRDKVPKESGEYQNKLIAGWSEQTIKEHVEAVATKAKNALEISAREFQSPFYDLGVGSFDCKFFNYEFSVAQSEENFSQCVFTGALEIQNMDIFDEVQNVVDDCFEFTFDDATSSYPESNGDLKEIIYSLDDNKKLLNETFEFSYENDFSFFQLVHKENGAVITVNSSDIEINFKKSEPISEMLSTLKEVTKKIFLTATDETFLLSNR